jgi:hypothetical protein
VVVWLRPDNQNPKAAFPKDRIHPSDAARKPATVTIDQPCCMFVNRITIARVGDTIVVQNAAPVAHNFFCSTANNGEHNPTIPAGQDFKIGPLVAESTPILFKCTIHPWMAGYIRIFRPPLLRGHRRERELRDQERTQSGSSVSWSGMKKPDSWAARRAGSERRSNCSGRSQNSSQRSSISRRDWVSVVRIVLEERWDHEHPPGRRGGCSTALGS